MMIGFAFQNGEGTIELFDEDQAHHLVAESHGRERDFGIGAVVHLLCEAVWPADDEDQPFGTRCHLLFEAFGELNGGVLFAVFIQKDDLVARL